MFYKTEYHKKTNACQNTDSNTVTFDLQAAARLL